MLKTMINRKENGKLEIQSMALELCIGDMFEKCKSKREVEWLRENLVSIVECTAEERGRNKRRLEGDSCMSKLELEPINGVAWDIRPGTIVRHFKGDNYMIVDVAEHTESGEDLVIYKALYEDGKVYARPYDMFISKVPEDKDNPTKQIYRFEPYSPSRNLSKCNYVKFKKCTNCKTKEVLCQIAFDENSECKKCCDHCENRCENVCAFTRKGTFEECGAKIIKE